MPKQWMPNQCVLLHFLYGFDNCCNARRENTLLKEDLEFLIDNVESEGNAYVDDRIKLIRERYQIKGELLRVVLSEGINGYFCSGRALEG